MSLNILLKRSSTANKRPTPASLQYGELVLNYDEATGGLFYKDDLDNIIKVGPCQISTTAPNASPAGSSGNALGEFWYDSANGILKLWDGSAWIEAAGGVGVATITGTSPINVDNTDPENPVISVSSATTVGNEGVVQLSSGLNDTSENGWAATPFAVSLVNDDVQTRLSTVDGGTMQGDILMSAGTCIQFSLPNSSLCGLTDSTSTTCSALAASATAVKSAYDLADAALPLSGGTMTGAINLAAAGVVFSDASSLTALSDSTSTTSSTTGASSTAVKSAYDLAAAALPLSGGTLTGPLHTAASGIYFDDGSNVIAISDSTSSGRSDTAASEAAVKIAYDLAAAALPASGGSFTGTVSFATGQVFPVSGIQDASLTDKGVVQIGTNIDVVAGLISVADGTTTGKGVVQLYDATDSSSTTLALTAAQGKNLQDQIDALVVTSNLTLAGTYNASTGLVDSVTVAGAAEGFAVGSALPAPSTSNADYFVIIDVQGSTGPSGTPPYHIGDWFLSTGTSWDFLNVGYQPGAATTASQGVVYLATDAEVQAGTDTSNKAVNPASLQSKVSDSTSTTSSTTIASSTAVKSAYSLADAALPKSGGTMTGIITFAAGQTIPIGDIQDASKTQKGVVQVGTNINVASGVISVNSASIDQKGVVQLENTANSTSLTTAPTSNALNSVKLLLDNYLPLSGGYMSLAASINFQQGGVAFAGAGAIYGITGDIAYSGPLQPYFVAADIAVVQSVNDIATAAIPESVATAKGDILVGTASGVVGVQAVGTNGQILVADSTATSGLAYTSTVDGGTY
jgi:hypothetical protein